ncbi:DUF3958 family protein [Carnobacterium gallinarum]|uniref:DUF3958 family protein n=1 Tax=Carnobacterium gallinarum TaxID=2749 RepID=UPI0005550D3A|nr:DUF3958 family protein [Carnobacterium gallinarum]
MDKWDELHKKERLLMEREDQLVHEKNQVQRINEAYEEYFNEGHHFMSDLQDSFYENDDSLQFEAIRDEYTYESNKVLADLEESTEELNKHKRKIQMELDEVVYDKRRVSLEEKEVKNEH